MHIKENALPTYSEVYPLVGIVLLDLIIQHFSLAVLYHLDIWNTDTWEACHVNRTLQQSYFVSIDGGIAVYRIIHVDSKNLQIGSLKWWNHYRNLFNWLNSCSRLVEPAKAERRDKDIVPTAIIKINLWLAYISLEYIYFYYSIPILILNCHGLNPVNNNW